MTKEFIFRFSSQRIRCKAQKLGSCGVICFYPSKIREREILKNMKNTIKLQNHSPVQVKFQRPFLAQTRSLCPSSVYFCIVAGVQFVSGWFYLSKHESLVPSFISLVTWHGTECDTADSDRMHKSFISGTNPNHCSGVISERRSRLNFFLCS